MGLAAISLGFVTLPGTPLQWLWGLVLVSAGLVAFGQAMNGLAGMFIECPHCKQVVRKAQKVCNHCLKPMEVATVPTEAEGKVARAGSGRRSKSNKL